MKSIIVHNQEFRYSVDKGGVLYRVVKKENGDNELQQIFGKRFGDTGRNVIRRCNNLIRNSKIDDDPSLDKFLKQCRGE